MAARKKTDEAGASAGNSGGMTGDKLRLECLKLSVSMSNTIASMRGGMNTPVTMAMKFEHYITTGQQAPE